jgi:hypothetical protein
VKEMWRINKWYNVSVLISILFSYYFLVEYKWRIQWLGTAMKAGYYVDVLISLWLFLFPVFPFGAQPKEFFLNGLKMLEPRSHACVELREEYVEQIHFFNPIA